MTKTAIVFFNLGGPDSLEAVEPFLFNLFNDKAIIGAPGPIRWLIAKLISSRRAPFAQGNYRLMGGSSPLLRHTQDQARALEALVPGSRVFIAMRYWHPMTDETVAAVKAWGPDRIVLLPLYPQYSTTTTGSSLALWRQEAKKQGLTAPTDMVCCYADDQKFAAAHAAAIRKHLDEQPARILFSAHGLPEKVIEKGDPYQSQIERSAAAIMARLGPLDHAICYQSRVGPMKWIGPSIELELQRAAADKVGVVVVPIAFVSDHVETLVELDIEYAELAHKLGVAFYKRAPGLNGDPAFIEALADIVRRAVYTGLATACGRTCGPAHRACPMESLHV